MSMYISVSPSTGTVPQVSDRSNPTRKCPKLKVSLVFKEVQDEREEVASS
jgi:hypothetical protein